MFHVTPLTGAFNTTCPRYAPGVGFMFQHVNEKIESVSYRAVSFQYDDATCFKSITKLALMMVWFCNPVIDIWKNDWCVCPPHGPVGARSEVFQKLVHGLSADTYAQFSLKLVCGGSIDTGYTVAGSARYA